LEELGPRAIEVDLFARTFVHDFEAVAWELGRAVFLDVGGVDRVGQDVDHGEGF
jgi:hypothetical protein